MLSRFHRIPKRNEQTDGRTELLYQYRASAKINNFERKFQIVQHFRSDWLICMCLTNIVSDASLDICWLVGHVRELRLNGAAS